MPVSKGAPGRIIREVEAMHRHSMHTEKGNVVLDIFRKAWLVGKSSEGGDSRKDGVSLLMDQLLKQW